MVEKKLTTIYIVRHGETEHNVDLKIQGQTDSPLTENGILQAKTLGTKFKSIHFDVAFSSDLLRAKRTAEIISLEKQLAINTTKLLRERAFGKFEGRPSEEFRKANAEFIKKRDGLAEAEIAKFRLYEGYETDEELISRLTVFLREAALAYPGKTILVVSHGSIMRSFLVHLGWATYYELPPGSFKNTGYVKLETDGVDFFLKEVVGAEKQKIDKKKDRLF